MKEGRRDERGSDEKNKWMIVFKVILGLFLVSLVASFFLSILLGEPRTGNVARIYIRGVITADHYTGDTSSEDVIGLIDDARSNPDVEAIIFDINSPGGSPVGSYEIAEAIKACREDNITTVALIREAGASGAYWIASSTDYIIANPLSMTGSIGVYGSYIEFSGLMQRYNVSYERLVAGKYKDYGSPYRKLTEDERKKLQGEIDEIYDYFIGEVADNRNLSYDYVKSLATGEVFTGMEALRLGLVDETGSFLEAEDFLKWALNTTEIEYVDYETERSFMDVLAQLSGDFAFDIGSGIGSSLKKEDFLVRT